MLKRLAWLGGVLGLAIALIVMAPAALLPQLLTIPHVKFEDTEGTVWHGSAQTVLDDQRIGALRWRVKPLDLFAGNLSVSFTLERDGVSLTGVSTSRFKTHEISLSGVVGSRLVNSYTVIYDIALSGQLMINDLRVRVEDSTQLESVEGEFTWNGGPVRFKLANVIHEVTLDPVQGSLSQDARLVVLTVRRTGKSAPVLAFRFNPETGWVHVRAFPAFLEFANIPSNYLMKDADFLFEVSQKLL